MPKRQIVSEELSPPSGHFSHATAIAATGTMVFVSGLTADAMLFVPETGTWTDVIAMPEPRAGASAVLLADGSAVFVGGSSSEGSPAETPGCPIAEPHVVRFVPAW